MKGTEQVALLDELDVAADLDHLAYATALLPAMSSPPSRLLSRGSYQDFDRGVAKKFVLNPHGLIDGASRN